VHTLSRKRPSSSRSNDASQSGTCQQLPHHAPKLMEDLIRSINGFRQSPAKLRGCIARSKLTSFFALRYSISYAAINNHWKMLHKLLEGPEKKVVS
jgi:hypothetical protein